MKNILIVAVLFLFASCTKTKTVDVIKTDTVSIQKSILGSWKSLTVISPIAFNQTTFTIQSYPAIPYLASSDTIYDVSPANIVYKRWGYSISAHNDTLLLFTISTTSPTENPLNIYTRL